MTEIEAFGVCLELLPERAIYIPSLETLLVADVHLGKSETFQAAGIPVPSMVNQTTLDRLHQLCLSYRPRQLLILGDLLHSRQALTHEVLKSWSKFRDSVSAKISLLVGNHDRPVLPLLNQLEIDCVTEPIVVKSLCLSHEPAPQSGRLNICGHVHPCIRLQTRLDRLRLPCFYWEKSNNLLILPSFGEFTGGYEINPGSDATVYVVAENQVIAWND
jgi:DNA ligase-associated metallophosphoesterase